MSAQSYSQGWFWQLLLLLLAIAFMFYQMIPFSLSPTAFRTPDILFCIIFALIIRRPQGAPFWLIGMIYFAMDIFLSRPMGVWTLCSLVASEIWRANRRLFRANSFFFEWGAFSVSYLATLCVNYGILAMLLVPLPPASNMIWAIILTAACYPVVIFILTYILRVEKPAVGETDEKGQKV